VVSHPFNRLPFTGAHVAPLQDMGLVARVTDPSPIVESEPSALHSAPDAPSTRISAFPESISIR
jgi:hypothetical protein